MKKKYKISLAIIIVLIVLVIGLGLSKKFLFKEKEEEEKNVTNVVSNIDSYGYTLDDRDTKYMKEVFKSLEDILNAEEINYEEYAKTLASLFIIDFYTLNNKINKYDVGSLEYILSDKVNSFKLKAMDTMYADIIDNTYKDRVQSLPEITNIEIEKCEQVKIKLNDIDTDSYEITLNYTYKEDLGYDKKGIVNLVKNDKKLEVAMYKPIIEAN